MPSTAKKALRTLTEASDGTSMASWAPAISHLAPAVKPPALPGVSEVVRDDVLVKTEKPAGCQTVGGEMHGTIGAAPEELSAEKRRGLDAASPEADNDRWAAYRGLVDIAGAKSKPPTELLLCWMERSRLPIRQALTLNLGVIIWQYLGPGRLVTATMSWEAVWGLTLARIRESELRNKWHSQMLPSLCRVFEFSGGEAQVEDEYVELQFDSNEKVKHNTTALAWLWSESAIYDPDQTIESQPSRISKELTALRAFNDFFIPEDWVRSRLRRLVNELPIVLSFPHLGIPPSLLGTFVINMYVQLDNDLRNWRKYWEINAGVRETDNMIVLLLPKVDETRDPTRDGLAEWAKSPNGRQFYERLWLQFQSWGRWDSMVLRVAAARRFLEYRSLHSPPRKIDTSVADWEVLKSFDCDHSNAAAAVSRLLFKAASCSEPRLREHVAEEFGLGPIRKGGGSCLIMSGGCKQVWRNWVSEMVV